ncbi:hypothetical protein L596_024801 [Steinernema carpocapsae]|uniref:Carbohydrate kinase FGGY N-terminal domain-containing protein n=1 Tax=Steinernema carpocapsae TaxID=34508 RepID=A0A4U5M5T8_STECR|nr:hypothetical protein L596_024801 [Steinernema carpocapsae]
MEPLFLGLDLSTQKLKAVIVTERLDVVNELSVDFDKDLPEFGTTNGVHVSRNEPKRITSPVRMWLKAVDLLLDKLEKRGLVGRIAAIGGCAQQHGTIYWSQIGTHSLTNLKPDVSLEEQLSSGFSIQDSPIWMDSSTCFECKEFEDFVGGPEILSKITGSRAYYRFSGPQILKLFQQQRDAYRATARISLISSFLCSLFAGKVVGIDLSDGSGMNLLDLRSKKWSKKLAGLIGDDLEEKLGDLKDNGSNWKISDYYVEIRLQS